MVAGKRHTVWISIWLSISWDSIAMSKDLNHSKDPKSRQTQKKYTFRRRVRFEG